MSERLTHDANTCCSNRRPASHVRAHIDSSLLCGCGLEHVGACNVFLQSRLAHQGGILQCSSCLQPLGLGVGRDEHRHSSTATVQQHKAVQEEKTFTVRSVQPTHVNQQGCRLPQRVKPCRLEHQLVLWLKASHQFCWSMISCLHTSCAAAGLRRQPQLTVVATACQCDCK